MEKREIKGDEIIIWDSSVAEIKNGRPVLCSFFFFLCIETTWCSWVATISLTVSLFVKLFFDFNSDGSRFVIAVRHMKYIHFFCCCVSVCMRVCEYRLIGLVACTPYTVYLYSIHSIQYSHSVCVCDCFTCGYRST